ncbi:MAG: 30S ribosomal protein S5 [Phycisphaera sp.]|nr:30S ribosomal protein S5 [Phycisphaera sp.]
MNTEESQGLESTTVGIYRTATVVKGGRRFSFAALVVVGDRHGSVGVGYGKAGGVPAAIEKAQKDAKKRMLKVNLLEGTLPHPVTARFGASIVKLMPAAPGTGVIAGGTVRAVLEMAGVHDCLTKSTGSTNQKNLCKAALTGLSSLRSKAQVEKIRGVQLEPTRVERVLEKGRKFMTQRTESVKAKGPVNRVGEKSAKGGRGRGRDRSAEGQAESKSQSDTTQTTDAGATPATE